MGPAATLYNNTLNGKIQFHSVNWNSLQELFRFSNNRQLIFNNCDFWAWIAIGVEGSEKCLVIRSTWLYWSPNSQSVILPSQTGTMTSLLQSCGNNTQDQVQLESAWEGKAFLESWNMKRLTVVTVVWRSVAGVITVPNWWLVIILVGTPPGLVYNS